ncbi:AAA family ATPase [Myroides sp. N17-2]|uniref:AAA family ATPase n=1 Tax=Myroides sp. N17-2 TaxID=2030799 RepID=UPI000EFBAC8A|nr:AAA family ATPase [Myroides sp. N17-2]
MRLIKSTFNNFRCFENYSLEYAKECTVLIGKNGSGKSSILSAIRRGMSFMFAQPKNFDLYLSTSNNSKAKAFYALEANFDPIIRTYKYPIKNTFSAIYKESELNWSMAINGEGKGLLSSNYSNSLNTILSDYNKNPTSNLPLLAVFSDSYPHQLINLGAKVKKIINNNILPRDFGYYGWDDRTNCIEIWIERFNKIFFEEKNLLNELDKLENSKKSFEENGNSEETVKAKDTIQKLEETISTLKNTIVFKEFPEERKFVQDILINFTKKTNSYSEYAGYDIELIKVDAHKIGNKKTLEFTFSDGRIMNFDTLPMGYKRLISIVFDIAYRSYTLNKNTNTEGIVLIDELELHLHPALQQDVLQRFKTTFPSLQFIITTHSPIVITNLELNDKNKIIKLKQEKNKYSSEEVVNTFGLDYNDGVSEIMGANYRQVEIDKLIDTIVILKKYDKSDQAEKLLNKLYDIVGSENLHINKEINKRVNQNK